MSTWLNKLKYDPVQPLLAARDEALTIRVQRDLLGQKTQPVALLWKTKEATKICNHMNPGGYWENPGKNTDSRWLSTFRQLRYLIEIYLMDRTQDVIARACEFLLGAQTPEGDIRGIAANQLAAYYNGAFLALLIQAGYADDPRIDKGLEWLLGVRQSDGGWVEFPGMLGIHTLTVTERDSLVTDIRRETARCFSPEKPFSILATGMAIRPFCLLPRYCRRPETSQAAELLKGSFFKKNYYSTYQHPDNWVNFQYPYWWNNLVSALDSLSYTDFDDRDADICAALTWLAANQRPDGLWNISYSKIHKSPPNKRSEINQLWVSFAICRVLSRFSAY